MFIFFFELFGQMNYRFGSESQHNETCSCYTPDQTKNRQFNLVLQLVGFGMECAIHFYNFVNIRMRF